MESNDFLSLNNSSSQNNKLSIQNTTYDTDIQKLKSQQLELNHIIVLKAYERDPIINVPVAYIENQTIVS